MYKAAIFDPEVKLQTINAGYLHIKKALCNFSSSFFFLFQVLAQIKFQTQVPLRGECVNMKLS